MFMDLADADYIKGDCYKMTNQMPAFPTEINLTKTSPTSEELKEYIAHWLKEANEGEPSNADKLLLIARESERKPIDIPHWERQYSYSRFGDIELIYRKHVADNYSLDFSYYESVAVTIGGSPGKGLIEGQKVAHIHIGFTKYLNWQNETIDECENDFWIPGDWEKKILPIWKEITSGANKERKRGAVAERLALLDKIGLGIGG